MCAPSLLPTDLPGRFERLLFTVHDRCGQPFIAVLRSLAQAACTVYSGSALRRLFLGPMAMQESAATLPLSAVLCRRPVPPGMSGALAAHL